MSHAQINLSQPTHWYQRDKRAYTEAYSDWCNNASPLTPVGQPIPLIPNPAITVTVKTFLHLFILCVFQLNIYSVMLSQLEYMISAFRRTKQPPILCWKIDVSSPTPPSTNTIQNISQRNNTRLPTGKLACVSASETCPMMLPPFCCVADPAAHLSIITSLVGCKLAHPPFWLQPQSAH